MTGDSKMFIVEDSKNFGFCKGIVRGEPFCPKNNVAKINVQIRNSRKNPKTKKYEINLFNFSVYGREEMRVISDACHDGDNVLVVYHLKDRFYVNKKTGVSTTYTEMIIDSVEKHGTVSEGRQPYINKGYFQGILLDAYEVPAAHGIYIVDMLRNNPETHVNEHFKFYAYGTLGEMIKQRFPKGKEAIVEYKLEKSKREDEDGKADYFVNCVIVNMT